ncbi:tRNA (adenosine(37)-N6)-threonylcarbamoyltransferase complex dimerization subunit type 1 TsaB [bacterium]|nr:tRNA (adenosine(37)-N6)-threonylcarbamoyltransferase complex dimerization subunit type 1 TsaB [bacterium]|tara:strand:- start:21540 stop:22211 length:672 start_codon:yes stop_codon:yes gene_type:complete
MILGIQTAQKPNGLALVDAHGHPMATMSRDSGRLFGDAIAEHAYDLCAHVGKKLRDLQAIGVVTGPGGYTAVRIGVALANSLAQAIGCPVYGLDTLTAMAQPYCAMPGTALVMTPTIGTQMAIQLMGFSGCINPLTPIDVVDGSLLSKTLSNVSGNLSVIGTLPASIVALENPALIRIQTLPDARVVAQWAAQCLETHRPASPAVSAYYAYDAVAAPRTSKPI